MLSTSKVNGDASTFSYFLLCFLLILGVPVRASPTNEKSLMHHKYCLIDAPCLCDASGNCSCNQQLKDANNPTAMLIIGSANWTTQVSVIYKNLFIAL